MAIMDSSIMESAIMDDPSELGLFTTMIGLEAAVPNRLLEACTIVRVLHAAVEED